MVNQRYFYKVKGTGKEKAEWNDFRKETYVIQRKKKGIIILYRFRFNEKNNGNGFFSVYFIHICKQDFELLADLKCFKNTIHY